LGNPYSKEAGPKDFEGGGAIVSKRKIIKGKMKMEKRLLGEAH